LSKKGATAFGPTDEDGMNVPSSVFLGQSYPNPFNPTTTIRFGVPTDAAIRLTVYSIIGEDIRTLVSDVKSGGTYDIEWDGTNDDGIVQASGVYYYRLTAVPESGGETIVRVMKTVFMR